MKRILSLILACLLLVSTLSVTVSCTAKTEEKSEAKTEEKTAAKTTAPASSASHTKKTEEAPSNYTKGSFDGSVYTNRWAGLKVTLPKDYTDGTEEQYASYESENTECGFYFLGKGASSAVVLAFEKLPAGDFTAKDYLDAYFENLLLALPDGYSLERPESYTSALVAEEEYDQAVFSINVGGTEAEQRILARVYDGYVILFVITGNTAGTLNTLVTNASKL